MAMRQHSLAAEREIVGWINSLRADGVPVSSKMLEIKALEVAETEGIAPGLFTASNTWKASFLNRHRLSFRAKNRAGQASPDDDNAFGSAFAVQVRGWMKQYGVTRVSNADQTAIFFEMLPKKTVSSKGAQTVWVKCGKREKQRATAMFLADSDGNKYPPFLVYKVQGSKIEVVEAANVRLRHGFGAEMWKEIEDIQSATGTQVYGNRTVWWNSDLTLAWLEYFFGDRMRHWTDAIEKYAARLNVIIKSVPPRLTWRCQAADVAWMKPLKDGLRRRWVDHLRDQLSRRKSGKVKGKFMMRPLDRGDVAEWVTGEWNGLSSDIITSGFSRCGFIDRGDLHLPEVQDGGEDLNSLVEDLCAAGWNDERVGEVGDSQDLVNSVADVVV